MHGRKVSHREPMGLLAAMLAVMLSAAVGPSGVAAAAARPVIGQASGSLGSATIDGQRLLIGAPVHEGSRIVTGATDSASVLLNSRVVIKFDANSAAVVTEANGTHVKIEQGNVEVFIAKRAPNAGAVALSDPDSTIEALGTVVVLSYSPGTRDGWYATEESTRARGVSVKGSADAAATGLPAGQFVALHAGKLVNPPAAIDPAELKRHLGTIGNLDKALGKHAGVFSRQQGAVAEFRHVQATFTGISVNKQTQLALLHNANADARNDSIQYSSVVTNINTGGIPVSGGTTGGGGGGTVISSGGFSDITAALAAGSVLNFNLFDSGIPDGDSVALRVTSNGKTVLNVPQITLSTSGAQFAPTVQAGTVGIFITALNEGSVPPNTGGVNVQNVTAGHATQTYSVNTGQTAVLKVKTP
jgi:hypothetical protein